MSDTRKSPRRLPATVVALGFVSLFTDFSSEMIYPLLPLFLSGALGAGAAALGVIEGCAETTAALLKVVSGRWADRAAKRKPFVLWGYGLSSAARPLIGLATAWPMVLCLRVMDRMGKGIRSSPRDAMIADAADPSIRGAAFGFHQAMDHIGAVLGPLAAAGLLYVFREHGVADARAMRTIFLLAAIPAAIVMAIIVFGLKEAPHKKPGAGRPGSPNPAADAPASNIAVPASDTPDENCRVHRTRPTEATQGHWKELGADFHWLLASLVVFTLGNSTDAFLLLRLGDAGWSASAVVMLYAVQNVVKMLANFWGGKASDRMGRKKPMIAGWLFYGAIYLCFACFDARLALAGIFLAYGIYFGLTEPVEKAWVADLAPAALRGTAFGWYNGAIGIAALPASLLFGALWKFFGAAMAFGVGAALAFIAAAMLMRLPSRRTPLAA